MMGVLLSRAMHETNVLALGRPTTYIVLCAVQCNVSGSHVKFGMHFTSSDVRNLKWNEFRLFDLVMVLICSQP